MKRATKKIIGTELNFDQNRITYDLVKGTRIYQDKDFTQQYVETFTEQYPKQVTDRHKAELKKFQEWKLSKEII